jgi:hypothetical protein
MKIPERIIWGVQNSVALFSRHPLLAWNLIRYRKGHKFFLELVGGANMGFHTTGDGWKEVGEHLKYKIWHRFTK